MSGLEPKEIAVTPAEQVSVPPAAATNGREGYDPDPKQSRKGLYLLIAGIVLGLMTGFIALRMGLSDNRITFVGLLLTLIVTIFCTGISNDYPSPKAPKGRGRRRFLDYKLRTRHVAAGASMAVLTFTAVVASPVMRAAYYEPAIQRIDALTCYIAGDSTLPTHEITLKCGGGDSLEIDVSNATPTVNLQGKIGDMDVTTASIGTSILGSIIVNIQTTGSTGDCSYSRDMANPPQATTVDCQTGTLNK